MHWEPQHCQAKNTNTEPSWMVVSTWYLPVGVAGGHACTLRELVHPDRLYSLLR